MVTTIMKIDPGQRAAARSFRATRPLACAPAGFPAYFPYTRLAHKFRV